MKTYRLKKWYPSLPNDWKEGHKVTDVYEESGSYISCLGIPGAVPRYEVESNPEFWEEIVEKDYKIIKIMTPNHPPYKVAGLSQGFAHGRVNWFEVMRYQIVIA